MDMHATKMKCYINVTIIQYDIEYTVQILNVLKHY